MLVGKYCGEQSGKEVFVFGKYAVIIFHSDSSTQERGFRMFFSFIQPSKCNRKALQNIKLQRLWINLNSPVCFHLRERVIMRGRHVDPSGSIMQAVGATLFFVSKHYNTFYRAFVLKFLG